MLASCAFQLFFRRIYTFYSSIWVFLAAIVLFEIEPAPYEAAPNLVAFIVGRAIAGIGSGGVFTGVIIIINTAGEERGLSG
jgi:MFS family permease